MRAELRIERQGDLLLFHHVVDGIFGISLSGSVFSDLDQPLGPECCSRLRQQVLERNGWRCQQCGHPIGPEVHHIQARSGLGDDVERNLITLCAKCHQDVHLK